jgi:hypothetical protein
MGRTYANCGQWCSNSQFSRNQMMKGEGYSRCKDCVDGPSGTAYQYQSPPPPPVFQCNECYREFNNQNELNMHMQVHRPRAVTCILCGERSFKSAANMVQHVESGYCTACKGSDNARQQIYGFANSQRRMQPYMTNTPLLTNGGNNYQGVPDLPYKCQECAKSFRQLSQLLQHMDNKHKQMRMIQY